VHEDDAIRCQHARQVTTILRPSLDFMVVFKPTKTHNMVAFMLDLQFKDLSLVINYVDHFFTIEIVVTYDKEFLFFTFETLY
jgi:hypothetical protein